MVREGGREQVSEFVAEEEGWWHGAIPPPSRAGGHSRDIDYANNTTTHLICQGFYAFSSSQQA